MERDAKYPRINEGDLRLEHFSEKEIQALVSTGKQNHDLQKQKRMQQET
jgi:hypothetical protein